MVEARWNGRTTAKSDDTVVVDDGKENRDAACYYPAS